jgi:membrane protein DedA with SNARE-associated domain
MLDLLYNNVSYVGIIAVLVISGTGLPIPEELPVILAGIAARSGQLEPWLAFLSCLVGSLGGDLVMYSIGRYFGRSVLREHPFVARFLKPEREAKIEDLICRHGLKVFFLARFLVGIRSPVFLTAGILRVPLRRFLAADMLSASVVIGIFFGLGYRYANEILHSFQWIRRAEVLLTVLVVLGVAGLVGIYWRRRQRRWQRVLDRRQARILNRVAQETPPTAAPVAETETAA